MATRRFYFIRSSAPEHCRNADESLPGQGDTESDQANNLPCKITHIPQG